MAKWDITVGREVLDTIEADGFKVDAGVLVFLVDSHNVGAVGMNEGIIVKLAKPVDPLPVDNLSADPVVIANLNRLIGRA